MTRTNADRIRPMTDDELMKFLCSKSGCEEHLCHKYEECLKGNKKKWLKKEVK